MAVIIKCAFIVDYDLLRHLEINCYLPFATLSVKMNQDFMFAFIFIQTRSFSEAEQLSPFYIQGTHELLQVQALFHDQIV